MSRHIEWKDFENNRLISWSSAGFLLGFSVPLGNGSVELLDYHDYVLLFLMNSIVGSAVGSFAAFAAYLRRNRPTDRISGRRAALAGIIAGITIITKLFVPLGYGALLFAGIFCRLVWVRD